MAKIQQQRRSPLSWLSIVLWLIANVPTIIDLIKRFLDLIHGMPHLQAEGLRYKLGEMRARNDVAGATALIRSHCDGVACPPETKGLD